MKALLATLPLVIGLGGCTMHWRYDVPALYGVVVRDGSPVQGAEVWISVMGTAGPRVAITAADGRFAVDPVRKIEARGPVTFADPAFGYKVEITVDGRTYAGATAGGMGYMPAALALSCDLSRPLLVRDELRHCTVVTRWEGA